MTIVLILSLHRLERKQVGGGILELKYFLGSVDLYKLIASTSHYTIQLTSLGV